MRKIINLHGPPGVGKSTLSKILQEKLSDYAYIDRPMIKRGLKPAGRLIAKKLSKQASYLIIRELIKEEKNILTEEISPISLKKNLEENYLEEHGYELHSFRLTCPIEIGLQRDLERSAKTVGEERMREFYKEYAKAEPCETEIDTSKHDVDECIEMIMEKVNS